jgi:hypothetical protein
LTTGGKEDRAILKQSMHLAKLFRSMADMVGLDLEIRHTPLLTRASRNAILRLLRPAEEALCRLIVMVMHQMFACDGRALPSRTRNFGHSALSSFARLFPSFAAEPRALSAQGLALSPKSKSSTVRRRLHSFHGTSAPFLLRRLRDEARPASRFAARHTLPSHIKPDPNEPVSRDALCWRLCALRYALETLPAQARRLARWQARARCGLATLPRQLNRTLPTPPGPGNTNRPPTDDTPPKDQYLPKEVEFLRWKPG